MSISFRYFTLAQIYVHIGEPNVIFVIHSAFMLHTYCRSYIRLLGPHKLIIHCIIKLLGFMKLFAWSVVYTEEKHVRREGKRCEDEESSATY